ncbi:MAG: hypothetical protein HGB03_02525 [Candidatus Yonathbacteria bacterium]|nr:hypothetical protein [Candidatus Yonathbacteria bacterium]NTW47484.1 hypothetical protein [Candidatus Yonathbacteria bacterium]
MQFGFSPEGEKLTPSEELTHLIDTYGDLDSVPDEIKMRIVNDLKAVGDERSLEQIVLDMQEENLMNAA